MDGCSRAIEEMNAVSCGFVPLCAVWSMGGVIWRIVTFGFRERWSCGRGKCSVHKAVASGCLEGSLCGEITLALFAGRCIMQH